MLNIQEDRDFAAQISLRSSSIFIYIQTLAVEKRRPQFFLNFTFLEIQENNKSYSLIRRLWPKAYENVVQTLNSLSRLDKSMNFHFTFAQTSSLKKVFEFFLQALRNRLRQSPTRKSNGKVLFGAFFDFPYTVYDIQYIIYSYFLLWNFGDRILPCLLYV